MALDHEKLRKTKAGNRGGGAGWKAKDGPNYLRILPPGAQFLTNWEALENLAVPFKIHYFKIEGRPTEVTRCLAEVGLKCPACQAWRAHRKSDDPALKQMAGDISPSDQYLFNVLDLENLAAGIQVWVANWTCWNGIMEIGANPRWGNVVDPADGINFQITLTPGARSRTGYNQYAVLPDGAERTTVMEILAAIENWQQVLDDLSTHVAEAKSVEEIQGLLDEMGFPVPGGARVLSAPRAALRAALPPAAPARTAPATAPAAAASAAPRPAAVAAAPARAAAPVRGGVVARPAAVVHAAAADEEQQRPEVHYDPGPSFVSKYADEERPVGAPRCFGMYDPKVHQCAACPVLTDCQFKMLDIAE